MKFWWKIVRALVVVLNLPSDGWQVVHTFLQSCWDHSTFCCKLIWLLCLFGYMSVDVWLLICLLCCFWRGLSSVPCSVELDSGSEGPAPRAFFFFEEKAGELLCHIRREACKFSTRLRLHKTKETQWSAAPTLAIELNLTWIGRYHRPTHSELLDRDLRFYFLKDPGCNGPIVLKDAPIPLLP